MRKTAFIVLLGILCLGAHTTFSAPSALSVLSAAPKGQQEVSEREAVSVHFNQPVAALGEETQFSSSNCPIQLTPKVEGTCRFSGTQTVLFEPSNPWPVATRFTAVVKAGFTSAISKQKLAKDYTFSFTTQVPQVRQVLPYNNEHWISLNPTLYVFFNMEVDTAKMRNYVTLTGNNQGIPLSIRPVTEEEKKSVLPYAETKRLVALVPLEKLTKDTRYTLQFLPGLPATSGNAGMTQKYETDFYTYPNLKVLEYQTSGCLPMDAWIELSSPVRLKELSAHMDVVPSSAKRELTLQEENYVGNDRIDSKTGTAAFRMPLSFIKVEPHQTVQVTLKKGMQDIYGNVLAEDNSFEITNSGYCPAVDFTGGNGVLESYLKPLLPIDLMNITSLPVQTARFNKENFVPFSQKETRYCQKEPLENATFSGDYTFSSVKDRTHKTFLDLSKFNPTKEDSIIFSQVQVDRHNGEKCWISSTDNITDIGVTFKTSAQDILLWTTSLRTGKPLGNLAVELRNKDNKVVWTGTSDENGLVRAPGWNKLDVEIPQWGRAPLYAFVSSNGGDAVVSNLWDDGMELWRFNIDYTYNPVENMYRSFATTDRGIYRPGETVYIKGVMRALEEGSYHLPGKEVRARLVLTDSQGEEALKKDITLSSSYGTFDTSFSLPAQARTGHWNLSLMPLVKGKEIEDSRVWHTFQVEAVKPAEFDVSLRSLSAHYLGGEEARFSLSAQYHFGGPLSGAPVSWTLRQTPTRFTLKGYEEYEFSPYFLREENAPQKELLAQSTAQLDSKGTFTFFYQMPKENYPVEVYAQAQVQSAARQDLFSRTSIIVHPASFYLGTRFLQEHAQADKPVQVSVVAITPEGKPTDATVVAEIYKQQWLSVRKTSLAGRLEWVSDKQIIPVMTRVIEVGKKGAKFSFIPPDSGNYFVRLSSSDEVGRRVFGGDNIYVMGKDDDYFRQHDDDLITLTPNKKEYKVGQTARILVESPYPTATALVTVEREGILDAWVTQVKSGSSYIPVKIKENYLPNAYVSVLLVQGRTDKPITEKLDLGKPQAKIGYTSLSVLPTSKKIETRVKTDAARYRPGEQVTLQISTQVESKGVPAEVTVMVVDEGILNLTAYKTPDLFRHFYGDRALSVFTMDNRSYLIGQRSFGEKGENRGGGGGTSSALGGTDLRSNFKFTPYFKANVQTDGQGRATVKFNLPDNLTKFRVMALAVREEEFGHGESSFTVSKPVMVMANLPRFARKGDEFSCSAIVHNYEDKQGLFTVQIQTSNGIERTEGAEKTIQVKQGSSKEVTWNCRAVEDGTATVSFAVNSAKHKDGVKQDLEISPVEKPQTLALYGVTDSSKEELLQQPSQTNSRANNIVRVSLASTALLSVKGAVDYLHTYPYDCLEQQLSKAIPALVSEPLLTSFSLGTHRQNRERVQNVLDNLPLYQYPSGGFSYWKNGLPDPYLTAYALEVAHLAKAQGYTVKEDILQKAVGYLSQSFEKQTRRSYVYNTYETDVTRAYNAYVLSLYNKNVEGSFNMLYAQRTTLPVAANAYLLKTAVQIKRPASEQQALAQELLNHLVQNPTSAFIDGGSNMTYLHLDTLSATALTLDAFVQSGQFLDRAHLLVAWLNGQLNANGYWKNTYTNALVLRALVAYHERQEGSAPHFTATVAKDETTLLTHTFDGYDNKEIVRTFPFAQIYDTSSKARLSLSKKGSGTLYYTLGQTYTPLAYNQPTRSGFTITRIITSMDDKPVNRLLAGERYKVTLTVISSAPRWFVALEDFIPAGFELVNHSLATEDTSAETDDYSAFTHTEQYDNRITAFADYLPSGTQTFSYVVTAHVHGKFSYPAAWVSQMYEPEVFGHNATSSVVIE